MLILFHCFVNWLYDVYHKLRDTKNPHLAHILRLESLQPYAQFDVEKDVKFDPPVYKQRYGRVCEILTNDKWKGQIHKVVDFGCAEFGLFVFLKNAEIPIRDISFVDIDAALLAEYLYRVYPLSADYLAARIQPMTVRIYTGSISNPDPSLVNTDAVIAIEIIEHLYPDVLEAVPYNFFGYIKPKLAIFTTPNAEFNVLFPSLKTFRHYDHKFEWNREQFQSWALNIVRRFPDYTVQFSGVGLGPRDCQTYGSCSQLAVFVRKDLICDNYKDFSLYNDCDNVSYGICTCNSLSTNLITEDVSPPNYYRLLETIEYPCNHDLRTEEERILDEIRYKMHFFGQPSGIHYRYELNRSEIPLRLISANIPLGYEEIKAFLTKFHIQIEECVNQETHKSEPCAIYAPAMDVSGSGSDTEASGYESDKNKSPKDEQAQFSDWDLDIEPSPQPNTTPKEKDMHLEMTANKKSQGALYDSGYQKSPTTTTAAEDSPPQENSKNQKSQDAKPNKLSHLLSVFDDFDKINELDATRREKKHFNFTTNLPHKEVMKKLCQEIQKNPVAGPSRDFKKKSPKKPSPSDSDDSAEEVRSITTCILENTLNKLEVREDVDRYRGDIIQDLIEDEEPPEDLEEGVVADAVVVENGDLANNNRDLEGNNYLAEALVLEEHAAVQVDNLDNMNMDNNNEMGEEEVEEPLLIEVLAVQEQQEPPPPPPPLPPPPPILEPDVEVAWSSREALFDVNSQVDLLEEFDVDGVLVNGIVIPENYVIVPSAGAISNDSGTELNSDLFLPQHDFIAALPLDGGFPNWLLQIFEESDNIPDGEEELHDEPHYYCQGDGLGVHPSTAALDDDDDDDDDGHETDNSESSSTSGSVSFVNAENSTSGQEVFMTPEGSRDESTSLVVTGTALNSEQESSEQDEVFENAEENESNLFASPY